MLVTSPPSFADHGPTVFAELSSDGVDQIGTVMCRRTPRFHPSSFKRRLLGLPLSGEFPHRLDNVFFFKGLGEKQSSRRQVLLSRRDMPGCHDNLDWRPSVTDKRRQFHAIDAPWHINIREDDADIEPLLEDRHRFIGVGRLDRLETGLLDHVDGVETKKGLVLDDEDNGTPG